MSLPKKKKLIARPSARTKTKNDSIHPIVDKYFAVTVPTPQWEPTDKDWELLSEMFRGR
jgi:hypothetical protein